MASRGTTFEKLQRERAKKAKAAAKREKRQRRQRGEDVDAQSPAHEDSTDDLSQLDAAGLLERIEQLQRRFEAGMVEPDEFEEQRNALFERLASLPAG